MSDILTLTMNPTIDKSTSAHSVTPEIKIRCGDPTFEPGGGGINVSRAAHQLGGTSTAAYTAGGGTGDMLRDLLTDEGIQQHPLTIQGYTRENLIVYEESTGSQYRFGMPGPHVTEDEWQQALDFCFSQSADYIVGSGSLPPGVPTDFYQQLAERARNRDVRVIIDTSGEALEACSRAGAYLMKPNLRELETLSGGTFHTQEDIIEMAQQLIADDMSEVLVISMGASGAMLVTADDVVQMRPPVVPIQSKVGAGDSMVGGIVHALAQGKSLTDAVRYGVAAGTAAVMTPGTELCHKDDTDRIYERIVLFNNVDKS